MIKKTIAITLIALLGVNLFLFQTRTEEDFASAPCAFCKSDVIERQAIASNTTTYTLYNYKPLLHGHLLIVPKQHVSRFEDLSHEEVLDMFEAIKRAHSLFQEHALGSDYVLLLQNGFYGGQTVNHTHFHLIPRSSYNVLTKVKIWLALFQEGLGVRGTISESPLQPH